MSYAGHAIDAINRAKYNESLKKRGRQHYRKIRDMYLSETSKHKIEPDYNNILSRADFISLKDKIRNNIKKDIRKRNIKIFVTISFVVVFVFVLFYFMIFRINYSY